MIEVFNLQKKVAVETGEYKRFVKQVSAAVTEAVDRPVTVAVIDDDRMKQLNEMFRGKDSTTDVLSFPHEPDPLDPDNKTLGDIVISAEQAQKQAIENDLPLDIEVKQLILHGLLHLCGYDHETDDGEMNELELELRNETGIAF